VNGSGDRGSSPLEESKRCMTVCIPGSILTLTREGVLRVEAGVRNSVQGPGSPYTLYISAQNFHIEDPLSATLGFSRMVNDIKK
jgi:hypothetical protein